MGRAVVGDAVSAGVTGAVFSAVPSTAWALLRGEDVVDGGRALGAVVLPHERRTPVLLAVAAPVHVGISVGWAAVMAAALPARAEPAWGICGGLAIAWLDLMIIGRHIPPIRSLPQGRQWADHVAYGLTVGVALRARRAGRRRPATAGRDRGREARRASPAASAGTRSARAPRW